MRHYMENLALSFSFDRKTMGVTFFVPGLLFLFALFLILFVPREPAEVYHNVIVIQGVFIPAACWGLTYRLSEMYEEGAQETLIPYYTRRFGLDFLRYFFLNSFGVLLLIAALTAKYGMDSLTGLNILHFVLLLLFYMFLGTALIVLLKSVEITLTIILIYTVLEVVTLGQYMPWPHIFLFDPPVWSPLLVPKFVVLSVAIALLIATTLVFIRRADRKPEQ